MTMSDTPATPMPRVQPDRLRMLIAVAGLSESAAAAELGVDAATLRQWCDGGLQAPRMALYALEYLASLRNADTDAVAVASRRAAVQARIDANRLPDPLPALALITIAEVYERMARRHQPADSGTRPTDPKKDLPRPS